MKHTIKVCSVLLAVLAALALVTGPSAAQEKKPNIVFILVDNVGWGDFGVYECKRTRSILQGNGR